ncbi:glycerophosphodiester phosphodiesterase [Clostridium botulinum]|uniref:glycerophosphoryl diester phosphodiesterase membrane domain-containing protein n=2 Tax=Clostridium botulinum TaxID=1491 RepID=UPI0004D85559|nr:glycerophosphodiester phosphodiesterase family protein [Clostridium botulinum]KEI00799.1 glycerophosphodiester phosphodiesterase [Clostridium botulinum C/D str. BKT75002]KEI09717.1 glycerophosphodiester phosphodiesterase [Clostridium botulinum C/D str. BKT2873]KGM96989.1 glycerophosphodiester phosphodiesterase [Clostridium botulinum D str. CCUG 7971]KOC48931.1 glycerophosphodiester phosphodiesterase [Clostridium botulinum]MCD3351790.1 glycerophosphodiester phosphodiesterase [Clostridium bot
MKYFKNEFRKIIEDFKFGWSQFLKYELATKLILTILIMPIFSFSISLLMKNKGASVLANSQILKFGLSKQGVLSLAILYMMAVFVILIEIGGLIVIGSSLIATKREYRFYSILGFCLKKIPKFIGIGGIYAVLFYVAFINFIGMQDYSVFGISLELPGFIQTYIDESTLLLAIELGIVLLIIFLFIRWIFTFHFIILENKSSREALKESWLLVRKNFKKVIKYFITIFILTTILIFIAYFSWSTIIYKLINTFNYNSYWERVFIIAVILIRKFIGFLVFFIFSPLQIHWITRLFYSLRKENNNESSISNIKLKEKPSILNRLFFRKKIIICFSILVVVLLSVMIGFIADDNLDIIQNVKVTAHRGNTLNDPENTLASIKSAIDCKADFAEIDVVQSKDSKVFLSHNFNLKKSTGVDENSWNLSYDDVKKLDGGVITNRMPLLEEAIKLSKGKIKLNIEIKANENEKDIVKNVVKIIEKENFIESCVVTSLDYDTLQKVKKLNPRIKIGYIIYLAKGNVEKLNTDFYSVEESLVSEDLISKAHSMGREVHVWTVNNECNMDKFIELGVDNIITDESEILIQRLKDIKRDSPFKRFLEMILNL